MDEALRQLDLETRTAIAHEKMKKKSKLREDELKQIDELVNAQKQEFDDEIAGITAVSLAMEKQRAEAKKMPERIEQRGISGGTMGMGTTSTFRPNVQRQRLLDEANTTIRTNNEVVRALREQREKFAKQSQEFKVQLLEETEANKNYNVVIKDNSKALSDSSDKQKTFKTELKDTNIYLSRQIDLLQELTEIEQERQLISAQKDIDAEFERQLKLLEDTGKFEADALNEMIRKKTKWKKVLLTNVCNMKWMPLTERLTTRKKEMDALFKEREHCWHKRVLHKRQLTKSMRILIKRMMKWLNNN